MKLARVVGHIASWRFLSRKMLIIPAATPDLTDRVPNEQAGPILPLPIPRYFPGSATYPDFEYVMISFTNCI